MQRRAACSHLHGSRSLFITLWLKLRTAKHGTLQRGQTGAKMKHVTACSSRQHDLQWATHNPDHSLTVTQWFQPGRASNRLSPRALNICEVTDENEFKTDGLFYMIFVFAVFGYGLKKILKAGKKNNQRRWNMQLIVKMLELICRDNMLFFTTDLFNTTTSRSARDCSINSLNTVSFLWDTSLFDQSHDGNLFAKSDQFSSIIKKMLLC